MLKRCRMERLQYGAALALLAAPAGVASALAQNAGAGAGEGPPQAAAESLLDLLIKGGPVMVPLALCSVIAVTVAILRLFTLRRRTIIPDNFMVGLLDVSGPSPEAQEKAVAYCERVDGPVGRIFRAGIINLPRGEGSAEKAIEDAGGREVDKLKRSLRPLSMVASISPLLGLLGTVYGMIGAFQTAALVGMGKADVLAKGIYEALVTTAAGLTIAIPAILLYQYFNGRVDRLVDEIDDMGIRFMEHLLRRNRAE